MSNEKTKAYNKKYYWSHREKMLAASKKYQKQRRKYKKQLGYHAWEKLPFFINRKGRKCATKGCNTILSIYNPNKYCWACLEKRAKKELGIKEV